MRWSTDDNFTPCVTPPPGPGRLERNHEKNVKILHPPIRNLKLRNSFVCFKNNIQVEISCGYIQIIILNSSDNNLPDFDRQI